MFKRILVANRGEIAARVMRTCREMGVETVAVYSSADRDSPHLWAADQAVELGPAEPAESYLNLAAIMEAARKTGAQAIHPGYGFLAENPALPRACQEEGLVFIGPPAQVMSDLGQKTRARRIMQRAGVPVIPGMLESCADQALLAARAGEIGYPLLVKAAAGGGGKGMRLVRDQAGLAEACALAEGEARAAFGDGSIYLEKHLERVRHVEVQILADGQGKVLHLFERECSIQRRHQKIIEETPSPALTPELRQAMGEAAVAAARAAGYLNAGTVEFLLDQEGNFYFLEVNARLQVEHAITELVCGLDLVRWQLAIAAGEPLGLEQGDIGQRGHAIQCRVYAEDPAQDFAPSPGRIALYREPTGPGVRVDSGVCQGLEVPMEYDPILAKLIVWGEDRPAAIARARRALAEYPILGLANNVAYLADILAHPAFQAGETHTAFLPEHFAGWRQGAEGEELARLAWLAAETSRPEHRAGPAKTGGQPEGPWQNLGNWRL